MDVDNTGNDSSNKDDKEISPSTSAPPAKREMCATTIFVKKLIESVKKHPCLYDVNHDRYTDGNYKSEIWKQIGKQFGRNPKDLKNKFMELKRKFVVYYAYEEIPKFKNEGLQLKDFCFYECLTFLKPKVKLNNATKILNKKVVEQKIKQGIIKKESVKLSKKAKRRIRMAEEIQRLEKLRESTSCFMPGPSSDRFMPNNQPYGNCSNFMDSSGPQYSDYRDGYYGPPSNNCNMPGNNMYMPQNRPQNMPDNRNFPNNDRPAPEHIDFFFKSVSQQIKGANLSSLDFLRLQYTIVEALKYKLETFRESREQNQG